MSLIFNFLIIFLAYFASKLFKRINGDVNLPNIGNLQNIELYQVLFIIVIGLGYLLLNGWGILIAIALGVGIFSFVFRKKYLMLDEAQKKKLQLIVLLDAIFFLGIANFLIILG